MSEKNADGCARCGNTDLRLSPDWAYGNPPITDGPAWGSDWCDKCRLCLDEYRRLYFRNCDACKFTDGAVCGFCNSPISGWEGVDLEKLESSGRFFDEKWMLVFLLIAALCFASFIYVGGDKLTIVREIKDGFYWIKSAIGF